MKMLLVFPMFILILGNGLSLEAYDKTKPAGQKENGQTRNFQTVKAYLELGAYLKSHPELNTQVYELRRTFARNEGACPHERGERAFNYIQKFYISLNEILERVFHLRRNATDGKVLVNEVFDCLFKPSLKWAERDRCLQTVEPYAVDFRLKTDKSNPIYTQNDRDTMHLKRCDKILDREINKLLADIDVLFAQGDQQSQIAEHQKLVDDSILEQQELRRKIEKLEKAAAKKAEPHRVEAEPIDGTETSA